MRLTARGYGHTYPTAAAAQRIAAQPPRARIRKCQKRHDLAREAVGLHARVGPQLIGMRLLVAPTTFLYAFENLLP